MKSQIPFYKTLVPLGILAAAALATGLSSAAVARATKPAPADSVMVARELVVGSQAQAAVKDLVEKGFYKSALEQWTPAYGRSVFAAAPTGRALHALIEARAGLETTALGELFQIRNPNQIAHRIASLWQSELPYNSVVLRQFSPHKNCTNLFSVEVCNTMTAWATSLPTARRDFDEDSALLTKLSLDNLSRNFVLWQMGLGRGVEGNVVQALKYFQELLDNGQSLIPQDEIWLASARLFYQDGKFAAAIKYDNKIPKDSDYWLEASEEKAWANVRLGNNDEALSVLKTLTVPFFQGQLGPEPYYLAGLTQVRVCNFVGAFKTLKMFKLRFKDRAMNLQKISLKPESSPAVIAALDQMEKGAAAESNAIEGMANQLPLLPRFYDRDADLTRLAATARSLKNESNLLNDMVADAPLDGDLVRLKATTQARYTTVRNTSLARMARLAGQDLSETKTILTKLHVVEIEAIQRMFPNPGASQKILKASAKASVKSQAKSGATITFPNDGEIWLDELDHYDVRAKGCPAPGGQTL